MIRSHSSRSRQEDIIFSKEPNPYTLKVESLLQSKNYDKLSNQQIIQENNLLRLHLKNFNNELNVIIERQSLKSNKKTNAAQFINKPASAKARTMIEEIKNNEKKLNLLREEFHRFSNRLQSISDGSYLINLQMKIDETKKSLDDQKKSNKEILLDQKKHGKNLDSLEQAGMPEKLAKGVEISTLLPGLSRRNQKLRERNDLVMIQTEELEKKNQLIQERYDKAIQLAEAYKLFKNDKKREQYEITQAKVEGHEKNIQVLKKKNEKVLEMHKKTMDEFHKNLKEKDEMISTKEKDLLIQRQKIEELMLTEKINKDALMKIMPPTPKSNIIHSSLETPKEDDPKSEENRDWMKEKEEIKLKQELHDYINKTIEIPQNDNDKAKENEKIHDSNQEILNNNSSQKKFYDLQNNKKNEESAKSINVNKEKEDKTLNKNNSHSHMRQEEQARNFNLNNKKGSIGQNIDKKPVEQEVKSTKDEDQLKNNNINKSPEHEEPKDFNLAKKSEEDQQQNLLNLSKNSEQEQPKSFNFSKNSEQEKPKSFNFSKKKVEETTNFIKPAELTNNMNNQFKPLENQKNNQNAFKKEKKIDLFNDSGDAKDFSNIPEIKTIDNNDQSIKNNTNTSNKSIKNNSNKLNNNETTNLSSNIQPITTTKPKKIIADPFEEKLKTENFDNEFVDDIETIQPKKLKMGGGIKAEKVDN